MILKLAIFVFLCEVLLVSSAPSQNTKDDDATNCGYQSCHPVKDGFINVHIVPHTHDDVGWLKTLDQYYYGNRNDIQNAGVQYILDTVVDALAKDPNRRFIYVETAFFWKWWIKQHDTVKAQVRKFVNNGQLEFIGGGWTMNDEAAAHYHSIIDQFTWGLRKLNETFGDCGRPKIGWQIDPFGHSKEMASIFAQLGFDGLLLGRIDYQEKGVRFNNKTAEMVWRGSSSLGTDSDIFTGVMFNVYGPPPGFCFDIMCNDEPIIDDPKIPDYNVDKRVDDLFAYLTNASNAYATNNVIITMGEDFHYQDAQVWYKNLDKLIYYSNLRQANGSKFNLIYSTPSCYVKAIYDETKGKSNFLLKEDDFFPYASDPHAFWTGYFTSRPTMKRFERDGNNFLQVCKQLYALVDLDPIDYVDLNVLREAMGVMQHHDAITGTEKTHVASDYARLLQHGFDECEFITATALSKIVAPNATQLKDEPTPTPAINFTSCLLTNISSCPISETQSTFVVTVYNPLSRSVNKYVRLPISGTNYKVTGPDGNTLATQIIPIPDAVINIPGRESQAKNELIFLAADIPALGFISYFIEQQKGNKVLKPDTQLRNQLGDVAFDVDQKSGFISQVVINNISLPVSQEFLYYEGAVGNNEVFENRSSGAYIFRPTNSSAVSVTDTAKIQIFNGEIVAEIHQVFNEWTSQIIRIFNKENFVEFDWIVGPLPRTGDNGKEVISRFKTDLASDGTFYTDSNGREMLKRIRDFRPTWNLELEEPISGNYYPVTSKILIRDEKQNMEVAVLTDRAQGGSSLKDGQIELMVNRICFHDDAFGVGEALMEEAFNQSLVARGSHYLIFGPLNSTAGKSIAAQERDIAQRKLLSSWTFLSVPNEKSFEEYKSSHVLQFAGLTRNLPDNVQILTLEPWKGMSFLLRLEHVLEQGEDATLSQPATVNLKNLFAPFEILSFEETTLAANQLLKDNNRLRFDSAGNMDESVVPSNKYQEQLRHIWNKDNSRFDNYVKRDIPRVNVKDDNDIVLKPMQIRTFIIEIKKN